MKYRSINNEKLTPYSSVTVTKLGNTIRIQHLSRENKEARIVKLDNENYLRVSTGEIKQFKLKDDSPQNQSRVANVQSLRHTFKNIRDLVSCNVTNVYNIRWITLTYKENMTDSKKLHEDFRKFIMRFKYYCKNQNYGIPEYIAVVEPQNRGAFHWHIFFIWDSNAPYIPNNIFAQIWGNGFTKFQALKNTDNIVGYLQSYLSDIEITDEQAEYFAEYELKSSSTDNHSKHYLKGGRLHMYPRYMNILRHSRGIKYPQKDTMLYSDALQLVSSKEKKFETAYQLMDEQGYSFNVTIQEYR